MNGENVVTLDHSLRLQHLHHSEVVQQQETLAQFGVLRLVKRQIQPLPGRVESLQTKTEREEQLSQFIVLTVPDTCYIYFI